MENTSLIALSRQSVLRRQMGIIAHNVANMNTTGFKAEKIMFIEDLVKSRGGGRTRFENLAFVRDIATVRDTREGPLNQTNNPLDLAVRGEGYFVINTELGERYTRNGNFRLDETGKLVTQSGEAVTSDGDQPFFFSPADREITISRDGSVSTNNGLLGKIKVVRFEDQQALRTIADGLYASDQQGEVIERPDVVQGMLEGSNINAINEITDMITVQRAYEGAKQLIDRENDRIQRAIRELGNQAQ
jgi:flagellar basal-body rod protein FlgF